MLAQHIQWRRWKLWQIRPQTKPSSLGLRRVWRNQAPHPCWQRLWWSRRQLVKLVRRGLQAPVSLSAIPKEIPILSLFIGMYCYVGMM